MRRSRWDVLRLALAVVWLVLFVSAVLLREDRQSLGELYAEVRAGEVERVELVGGVDALFDEFDVPAGAGGSASLDVRWGGVGDRRVVLLREVRGDGQSSGSDGRETTEEDVAAQLRLLDPDLEVVRRPAGSGGSVSLLGARLPGAAALAVLLSFLATLALLVAGPQPWRATRWAWFWLLPVPFAAVAFCLLSGPTPGVPAPASERRLTGGWAFLLGALLGGGTWAS